ncbi:MAG TPA: polysaccharide deacetylase family protein [Gemmatimonadales bacterium]|nr:polysaccharide deacetylase family protein [Gemmatimonadales bacterium]
MTVSPPQSIGPRLRACTAAGALLLAGATALPAQAPAPARAPNPHGQVPILEYHLIDDRDSRWGRSRDGFRRDLKLLYDRGYRPVSVAQLVDRELELGPGLSPVVFTFDDASPGQFRYLERDGRLDIDPESALGIWLEFARTHPDWAPRATFCLLPAASHGHAFFGDKGIQGQKSEWRFPKLRALAERGFELCAHTLWHANLGKLSDAEVQEQIARSVLAVDSAVPGYRVRSFALPLGIWPKNRALARAGSWRDPRTGRVVHYAFDAVLRVSGGPAPGPYAPEFDPASLPRVQVIGENLAQELDRIERTRYVSDGRTVRRPDGQP